MNLLTAASYSTEIYNINFQFIAQFFSMIFLLSFVLLSIFYYLYLEKLKSISYMVGLCISLMFNQYALAMFAINKDISVLVNLHSYIDISLITGYLFFYFGMQGVLKNHSYKLKGLNVFFYMVTLLSVILLNHGQIVVFIYTLIIFVPMLVGFYKHNKSNNNKYLMLLLALLIYISIFIVDNFLLYGEKISINWIFIVIVLLYFVFYFLKRYLKILNEKIELYDKLVVDEFTGLHTKAYFLEALENLYEGYLILFDINKFKSVNDQFGHVKGDELLLGVSENLKKHEKNSRLISRIGGDEFLIYVPKIKEDDVEDFAKLIVNDFMDTVKKIGLDCINGLGISVGITKVDGRSRIDISKSVDDAMYQAKTLGNNKIIFYKNGSS